MDINRSNSVTFAEFRRGWQNVGLYLKHDPDDYRLLFDRVFDRDRNSGRVRWVDLKQALTKFKLKAPRSLAKSQRKSLMMAAQAYDRDVVESTSNLMNIAGENSIDRADSNKDDERADQNPSPTTTSSTTAQRMLPTNASVALVSSPAPTLKSHAAGIENDVWAQRVDFLIRINSIQVRRRDSKCTAMPMISMYFICKI